MGRDGMGVETRRGRRDTGKERSDGQIDQKKKVKRKQNAVFSDPHSSVGGTARRKKHPPVGFLRPAGREVQLEWTSYQSDVRSGPPQGSQGSASRVLERLVSRQSTQRGKLQDEGPHAGCAGDGRLGGTDAVQEVDRSVRHAGGGLERCGARALRVRAGLK